MRTPESVLRALFTYCRDEDWAGHDPYDALNSPFLAPDGWTPKLVRLAATQFLKRSPIDLRWMLRVPRTQNAKAFALNLRSVLALEGLGLVDTDGLADYFIAGLERMRAPGQKYWNWGYSFPWQTRTVCVPRDTPNLVCTTFVADALLQAWERRQDDKLLDMALSAGRYIGETLYYENGNGLASFSYPSPGLSSTIHNANLLAAALLLRIESAAPGTQAVDRALKAARYSAGCQRADGSWAYGENSKQGWVDNFHTGYNLSALRTIARIRGSDEYAERVNRGFAFYRAHFLREDGAARYFHDNTWPIDIHCVAQTILTFLEFSDIDPDAGHHAQMACQWALENMWDEQGYFHYRKLRFGSITTSYMRWSQAWMLLALATLAAHRAGGRVS
ncbi:MAG TPA: hypothetical protein VFO82_14525 [Steroidobacteraceae bacterium]|nr:hypothetical protein [Steroidobacteraceae bacterium]